MEFSNYQRDNKLFAFSAIHIQCNKYLYQKALEQLVWKIPCNIITIHMLNLVTSSVSSEVNLIKRT